jgi:hypothetical protein
MTDFSSFPSSASSAGIVLDRTPTDRSLPKPHDL